MPDWFTKNLRWIFNGDQMNIEYITLSWKARAYFNNRDGKRLDKLEFNDFEKMILTTKKSVLLATIMVGHEQLDRAADRLYEVSIIKFLLHQAENNFPRTEIPCSKCNIKGLDYQRIDMERYWNDLFLCPSCLALIKDIVIFFEESNFWALPHNKVREKMLELT